MGRKQRILVVGAGIAGATAARIMADHGHHVTIIDQRNHIAGNAYDYIDHNTGLRIHKYGPHIFHTDNEKVYQWITKFSKWQSYQHKVMAQLTDGQLVPFPPNLDTLKYVDSHNLLSTFYIPYSEKMWGTKFDNIDNDIINRVKVKNNQDPYYFRDKYQLLPVNGYTAFIRSMIDHNLIEVKLGRKFEHSILDNYDHCFNSMSIDEFYQYRFGELSYRSLQFTNIHLPIKKLFPVSVVNFTDTGPFTRVTEWKNFPNSPNSETTVITLEQPCDFRQNNGERYYPVKADRNLYKEYSNIKNLKVTFIGRCGLYTYLDMDMAIHSTMHCIENYLKNFTSEKIN